jgi:hypothetical protein
MTPTMRKAIKLLFENGCSGAITKRGTLLAEGEELAISGSCISSKTWLQLVSRELICAAGPGRLRLTARGMMEAQK